MKYSDYEYLWRYKKANEISLAFYCTENYSETIVTSTSAATSWCNCTAIVNSPV